MKTKKKTRKEKSRKTKEKTNKQDYRHSGLIQCDQQNAKHHEAERASGEPSVSSRPAIVAAEILYTLSRGSALYVARSSGKPNVRLGAVLGRR